MFSVRLINLSDTQYDVIKEAAKDIGWKLSDDEGENWDIFWSDLAVPNERLSRMFNFQKLNHFPGTY